MRRETATVIKREPKPGSKVIIKGCEQTMMPSNCKRPPRGGLF
jgi:hypothetical protein